MDYRIIQNARGFIPQKRAWNGWESLTDDGAFFGKVRAYNLLENARAAIDSEEARRSMSNGYHTGKIVEYYKPGATA